MYKLRYYLDTNTLKIVYYSLFYLHIQYCICLGWCCWLSCEANCLYAKKNCEICLLCAALTLTDQLFIKTGFLKLNEVLDLQICKLMQSTIRGCEVDHNCFTPVSSIHSHYTEFSKKSIFVLKRCRALLGLNSFRYLGS